MEGFEVKHVDEYHLTGIWLDMFVKWEHRPPSSTDGRGEKCADARGEARAKPQQMKPKEERCSEGLVSERCISAGRAAARWSSALFFPVKSQLTFGEGRGASLGQLWLELLRFYTLEFALEEHIISIRLKELLSRETKNWPRRRLAIEGETIAC